MEDVTARMAQWIVTAPSRWPEPAMRVAQLAFIDYVACVIPGVHDVSAQAVGRFCDDMEAGPCTRVGSNRSQSAPWAALHNGTAAHALELDDNFYGAGLHATAVLAPCVLALAEQAQCGGADVLDAYLVGLQIAAEVSGALNPTHGTRGWHTTATIGSIAACAAAARILKLDPNVTRHALGLATSMASGSTVQYGSLAKPLHAGLAAKNGIVAALLAHAGLTAATETLDGPKGFRRLMTSPDIDALADAGTGLETLGFTLRFNEQIGAKLAVLQHGLAFKKWPNCGSAHASVQCLTEILAQRRIRITDVESITATTAAVFLRNLVFDRPTTGAESRFSLPYALIATILNGGALTLADFTDAAVRRPERLSLLPLVQTHTAEVDFANGNAPAAELSIAMREGEILHHVVPFRRLLGSPSNPIPENDIIDKLRICAQDFIAPSVIDALSDCARGLSAAPNVSQFMALLAQPHIQPTR